MPDEVIVETPDPAAPAPDPAPPADPAPAPAPAPEPAKPTEPLSPEQVKNGMVDALNKALGPASDAPKPKTAEPASPPAKPAPDPKAVGPDGKPKTPDDKGKADDLTTMPEGLQPKAQERFHKMADKIKEQATQLQQVTEQSTQSGQLLNDFRTTMREAGVTGDDWSLFLDFKKAITTGNTEVAAKILRDQLKTLSLATGKRYELDDPLVDYPDLQKDVEELRISPERALELARSRAVETSRTQVDQRTQQNNAAQAEQQKVIDTAINAIAVWAKATRESDIDFTAKHAKLKPLIDEIAVSYPPHLWVDAIQKLYNNMILPGSNGNGTGGPAPLRGGTGGGAKPTPPKDMLEALSQGLGWQ